MLFSGKSSCTYQGYEPTAKTSPMANAFNFKVIDFKYSEESQYIAAKVHYPDAIEYNGIKILVYHIERYNWLNSTKELDPHFLENKNSPIARFPGNDEGWNLALNFIGHK